MKAASKLVLGVFTASLFTHTAQARGLWACVDSLLRPLANSPSFHKAPKDLSTEVLSSVLNSLEVRLLKNHLRKKASAFKGASAKISLRKKQVLRLGNEFGKSRWLVWLEFDGTIGGKIRRFFLVTSEWDSFFEEQRLEHYSVVPWPTEQPDPVAIRFSFNEVFSTVDQRTIAITNFRDGFHCRPDEIKHLLLLHPALSGRLVTGFQEFPANHGATLFWVSTDMHPILLLYHSERTTGRPLYSVQEVELLPFLAATEVKEYPEPPMLLPPQDWSIFRR